MIVSTFPTPYAANHDLPTAPREKATIGPTAASRTKSLETGFPTIFRDPALCSFHGGAH